ncbi:hypothetical protein HS088_TW12G01124 [Tripterygium wilfordii]|uniref:Agenet domain-containing protein n=1 Tax=Tripterygium wilfordii TaxID=458696 RepID=A0A7J7D0L8_TRIWF|nr:hypothetical protein HS088_TW12G01124 [Tripterygium wilfordii]
MLFTAFTPPPSLSLRLLHSISLQGFCAPKPNPKLTMGRKPKSRSAKKSAKYPHFKPGSPVEISSNEEGFRGSWFTGTVIGLASPGDPSRLHVEYTSLFVDEEGTAPLREIVDTVMLRPVQPPEKEREFKFDEEVDAFHSDGWWEGVITKEEGEGRFTVYFRRSKEEMEFGKEQLRLHREWANGAWKPPFEEENVKPNQEKVENLPLVEEVKPSESATEHVYRLGTQVEVSSDEKGFEGVWFAATVVEPWGKDKFRIEYQTLKTEDDKTFLREEVDILHIRPSPPEILMVDGFKLFDEVDALYNDGWWVGVIARAQRNSKHIVYFKTTSEEIEFRDSELRLHQDWIDGKWVMASRV